MIEKSVHKSVLLNETIEGLNLTDSALVLDATLGGGGHLEKILNDYKDSKVIAIDTDENAIERAKKKFKQYKDRVALVNENFRNLDKVLQDLGIDKVDAAMFDLGLSSDQLEEEGRGFSFQKDEPLQMTMKFHPEEGDTTASDVVNEWDENTLADIIYGFGEERYARRIAKAIALAREEKVIETTGELARIIEDSVPAGYRKGKIHPATKTFQAIRIAVNDELNAVDEGIRKAFEFTREGGRIAIISFHSLEDRIVKKYFKELKEKDRAIFINKKPITASVEEVKTNPRSRSAKLRIIEKINT